MKKKKNRLSNFILAAMLLIGLSLLLYPSLSDYWNSFHQSRAIMRYMESVGTMDTAEYDAIMASARAYNRSIDTGEFRWFLTDREQARYEAELNFNRDGNMGFITIDKIHVQLPIYHGTSEPVLQTSIGHIEWSSLPVGGEGTHCVLSGHRGLPSAKLFSDLDKLTEGDVFSLSVLNEAFTYQVDQIRVVEPEDIQELQIILTDFVRETGSAAAQDILDHFEEILPYFKKIVPHDYRRMLAAVSRFEETGLSHEAAELEAFHSLYS